MSETIKIALAETRSKNRVVRTATFSGRELWWDISGPQHSLPLPLTRHDMAATALAFYAMNHGANLYVDGPVSRSLLESLEKFVACWVLWCPRLYKRIDITAAEEIYDDGPAPGAVHRAVAAFSGGVDSSFTVWRHVNGQAGRRSRQIIAASLIHGMDIPLANESALTLAMANASTTLSSVGVPLFAIRTNWRDVVGVNWEMEYGTAISTCLRNWQGAADTALLGSDCDYARLVLPWGGNPITYGMLSAHDFTVSYDGGEFSRTEKVEHLLAWTAGLRNLRVCWEGPITGRNCGRCEKCLRTKLNFLAVGVEPPMAIPGIPTPSQIFRLRAPSISSIALLTEIVEIARKGKIRGTWLTALRVSILKNRALNRLVALRLRAVMHTLVHVLWVGAKKVLPPAAVREVHRLRGPPSL
jgi:hypothetical protein